jgi:hypothetical protein
LAGAFWIRITVKTPRETSTATAKKSSKKPIHCQWPSKGMKKSRSKRAP